jgi:hypothetical protein
MLCTALAVGLCHINVAEGVNKGLCKSFNLTAIKAMVATYASIQVAHYLISIYHCYRHTEIPRQKETLVTRQKGVTLTQETRLSTNVEGGSSVDLMDRLDHFDESMTTAWKWWEYRMNKLFGASISHQICKIADVILEGVTVVLLVTAAHNSHGNLQNLQSIGTIFIPIYLKLFIKAFIQFVSFVYYCKQTCNAGKETQHFEFLHEPANWVKPLEHAVPFLAYLLMGLTALSVGYCHLDLSQQSMQLCKMFPYGVVKAVVVIVALWQLAHHFIAIYHHHVYASKPKRKTAPLEEIPMSETTSHYGQLR